jgi:hypothetical protein
MQQEKKETPKEVKILAVVAAVGIVFAILGGWYSSTKSDKPKPKTQIAFAETTALSKKASTLKMGMSLKGVVKLLGNPTWLILPTDGGEYEGFVPPGLYGLMWINGECAPVAVHFKETNSSVTGWDEGKLLCGEDPKLFNPSDKFSIQEKDRSAFFKSKLNVINLSNRFVIQEIFSARYIMSSRVFTPRSYWFNSFQEYILQTLNQLNQF